MPQLLSGDPKGSGADLSVDPQAANCVHREQELVQLRASRAPAPGGQEPPSASQLKVAFGDSPEGQAE